MIGPREKQCVAGPDGKHMTVLDCQIGGHSGAFTITRVWVEGKKRWGCDACLAAVPAPPSFEHLERRA